MNSYAKRYLDAQTNDDIHNLIKELILENTRLYKDNLLYRNIEIPLLKSENDRYKYMYIYDEQPMAWDNFKMREHQIHFLTITFDPDRFDNLLFTTEEQQKNYILWALSQFKDKINFIYGCFEKHDSGIIHSHILINFFDSYDFQQNHYKSLKAMFTKNIRNEHAIKLEPVNHLEKVAAYIDDGDKIKYGFFMFYHSTNYLY
jgi:hypothetical protein